MTAEPLVLAMLGTKWADAAPVVRILALAMPFMTLQVLYSPACDAIGRPEVGVRNGAEGAVVLTLAFLVGVQWGVTGLALAWVVAYPLYLLLGSRRALPVIGAGAGDLVRAIASPLAAAMAMAAVVATVDRLLPPLGPAARLGVLVAVGGGTYAVALATIAKPLLAEIVAIVRR